MLWTTDSRYLFQVDFMQGSKYPPANTPGWCIAGLIGLESASHGTHSMQRTKAAQTYRKTATCAPCSTGRSPAWPLSILDMIGGVPEEVDVTRTMAERFD
jgi:hypothetical protein